MSGSASSALDALGRGAELVRRLPGWSALLVLTAMPVRLLTALLVWQVWQLGADARHHADALTSLALVAFAAWVVSLLGRLWFVRACRFELDGGRPTPRAVLRVPTGDMVSYLYVALLMDLLFWAFLPSIGIPWLVTSFAALAASAAPSAGAGMIAPLRALGQAARPMVILVLGLGFTIALPLAFANLHLAAQAGLWLAGGVAGFDLTRWHALLDLAQPLYDIQLVAGATLLIEPFWLAAMTVAGLQTRARRSGEDLRQWFGELAAQERA